MSKLQQLTERTDYAKATTQLRTACAEIAGVILSKMRELDVKNIIACDRGYYVQKVSANGYHDFYLADDEGNSLEATKFYHYCGDFTCPVEPAAPDMVIAFANDLPEIIAKLDKIETEKANEASCPDFFSLYKAYKADKDARAAQQ